MICTVERIQGNTKYLYLINRKKHILREYIDGVSVAKLAERLGIGAGGGVVGGSLSSVVRRNTQQR